jgi:hypothetical protein
VYGERHSPRLARWAHREQEESLPWPGCWRAERRRGGTVRGIEEDAEAAAHNQFMSGLMSGLPRSTDPRPGGEPICAPERSSPRTDRQTCRRGWIAMDAKGVAAVGTGGWRTDVPAQSGTDTETPRHAPLVLQKCGELLHDRMRRLLSAQNQKLSAVCQDGAGA